MEKPRTDSARDHDDHALIDEEPRASGQSGGSGGNLAADVSSEDELDSIDDPEGRTRVRKQDSIAHGQSVRPDRPRS